MGLIDAIRSQEKHAKRNARAVERMRKQSLEQGKDGRFVSKVPEHEIVSILFLTRSGMNVPMIADRLNIKPNKAYNVRRRYQLITKEDGSYTYQSKKLREKYE